MIAERRVAKDGVVVETPATILESLAGVTVDGNPVGRAEQTRLFRFHKPAGLLTAERDPAGRPTIYAALRNALPAGTPRLMPVGRLDLNTEGLLLLTNDGGFKRELELPSSKVPRTYRARTFGTVSQSQLEDLMDGITIEGVHYGPINANLERRTGRNQWIELTLTEGKNREVRRVLEYLGLQVSRLLRIAYGPFVLGDLAKGATDEVRRDVLERFQASLRKAPGRGGDEAAPEPVAINSAPHSKPAPPPRPQAERPAPSSAKDIRPRLPGRGKPEGERRSSTAGKDTRPRPPSRGKPEDARGDLMSGKGARPRPPGRGKPDGERGSATFGKDARPRQPGRGKPDGERGSSTFGKNTRPRPPGRDKPNGERGSSTTGKDARPRPLGRGKPGDRAPGGSSKDNSPNTTTPRRGPRK
jgi:23S rRNA pseudouridine2605 synthase